MPAGALLAFTEHLTVFLRAHFPPIVIDTVEEQRVIARAAELSGPLGMAMSADTLVILKDFHHEWEDHRVLRAIDRPCFVVATANDISKLPPELLHRSGRDLTTPDLLRCAGQVVPLAVSQRERIGALRSWLAEGRAQPASTGR